MNKKQIIDKIIDDLPTRDMRGEMSPDEWYGWFEEAFDKGYAEALPTDEEISKQAKKYDVEDMNDAINRIGGFIVGAKWMRDFISGNFR